MCIVDSAAGPVLDLYTATRLVASAAVAKLADGGRSTITVSSVVAGAVAELANSSRSIVTV